MSIFEIMSIFEKMLIFEKKKTFEKNAKICAIRSPGLKLQEQTAEGAARRFVVEWAPHGA